jgi:uncharacterized protein YpmS
VSSRVNALLLAVCIALSIALFVSVVAPFQPPQHEQQQQQSANPGADQKSTKIATEERIADYTWWLAWLTGVLAFSTIGLWVATILTLRHSRETAERQLRAYVSFELKSINVTRTPIGHVIVVGYLLTNAGQTPAYRVRVDSSFRTLKWPIPPDEKIERPPPNTLAFAPSIGPQQTRPGTITKTKPISESDLTDMNRNDQFLYVVARVTYEDTFGNERHTEHCGSLRNLTAVIDAGRAGTVVPQAFFDTSDQYNDAS